MGSSTSKFSTSIKHGHVRLMKSARSGIWQIKYRDPKQPKLSGGTNSNYRYIQKSLDTTIKTEAIKVADLVNMQIANKTLGIADGTIPLYKLYELYFAAKEPHLKFEGIKRTRSGKNNFDRWLKKTHPEVQMAKDVTPQIVRDFQLARLQEGKAKRTVDNDITNLHSIFRWAMIEKYVKESPFAYSRDKNVSLFKEVQEPHDVYTECERQKLIEEAEKKGDFLVRDLIIILSSTGMRFEEAANLVPEALLWDRTPPVIEIRARNGWSPKDSWEVKTPPMSVEVQEVLKRREAEANGGYLFQNTAGKKAAANKTRERLQALFPEVGIDSSRRLHWHSWRNYFIHRCVQKHVDLTAIMSWVGHDSLKMVMHYTKVRDNTDAHAEEFLKLEDSKH